MANSGRLPDNGELAALPGFAWGFAELLEGELVTLPSRRPREN
jgi:hypothetical protein